jgi:uncharacterized protein (UPF0303 family)
MLHGCNEMYCRLLLQEDIHMDDILTQLLQEEQELQFVRFNEDTAWKIGRQLVEYAVREGLSVTIDITRGEHQLFHASLRGTTADNDEWVKRKVRLVNRFAHSSFYMGQFLKSKGKRIEEVYLLSESEYAAHGGCFPIIVIGTGMVGTITVSGLPQEEDHKLVVQTIRDFLAQEK